MIMVTVMKIGEGDGAEYTIKARVVMLAIMIKIILIIILLSDLSSLGASLLSPILRSSDTESIWLVHR